jgi:hypothetical protein
MGLFYCREHINLHSFILDVDLIKCSIRTTDMHAIYRGIDWEIKFLFISEISRKRIDTKFFQIFLNYFLRIAHNRHKSNFNRCEITEIIRISLKSNSFSSQNADYLIPNWIATAWQV